MAKKAAKAPARRSAQDAVDDDLIINAAAERALFVEMLTRDIESIPAIMDLIDNSIDGARALADEDGDLSQFWVNVVASGSEFMIEDNCGGIELDVARKYAFRFGRPEEYKGTKGSVGQFGVGMKRALFKLGRRFAVDSRAESTSFSLEVPVDDWVADDNPIWRFEMQKASRNYDSSKGGRGTKITVTELRESIAEDLADAQFLSLLREQIRYRHQAAIDQGVAITLNRDLLRGYTQELLVGKDFAPVNRTFVLKTDTGDVAVRIIAGIVPKERSEIAQDEGDAENFRGASDAGWWIFCNDRLLFMRNRDRLTGWGDPLPSYHPQYRQFRGWVWMSAADTAALPWNTTKTGVDEDSRVWRSVQAQIKVVGLQVVSVLNKLKTEEQKAEKDADMPTVLAMRAAKLVLTKDIEENETFHVPAPPKTPRKKSSPRVKMTHFQFDVPTDKFNEVGQKIGTSVVAEVGRRVFDYYYDREIGD